ncbi:MAG TPA: MBL fold metallo-hydrolase [Gaiellaceae bacterium]|nr:MBL fold metallo-hydrolase [Gaiellaceae bacterium]
MPLAVDRYELGPSRTNCYVVRADRAAEEAVVIDPGADAVELRLQLARTGARCVAILVTHTHYDHIGAVAELAEATGAPVYAAAGEAFVLERPDDVYAALGIRIRGHRPDVQLQGDETLEVAGLRFETLPVPGHSPFHLAFAVAGALFSGDVLFAGSVGRVDLPGGDWETLLGSIRTLAGRFAAGTVVYAGHGPPTTLGDELAHNPFLAELRAS